MTPKKLFLACALALTAGRGKAQQDPNAFPAGALFSPKFYPQKELLVTLTCHHSDRATPYNEFNPGMMVISHYNETSGAVTGFYRNSNFGISPLTASIAESHINFGYNNNFQFNYGIVIGFAGYKKKQRNIQYTTRCDEVTVFDPLPEDTRKRGRQEIYYRDDKGVCYKMTFCRRPRGEGCTKPRFVVFPTASLLYKENGIFVIGALAPYLGKDGGWGGFVGGGLRLNPFGFLEKEFAPPKPPAKDQPILVPASPQ